MRILLLLVLFFALVSCGGDEKPTELKIGENTTFEDYSPYINEVQKLQKKEVLSWVNDDYPLKLTLFSDHSFEWTLRVLGTGNGEWEYSQGKLELKSRTHLFDMEIDLAKINDDEFIFHFTDRFGTKILPVKFKKN